MQKFPLGKVYFRLGKNEGVGGSCSETGWRSTTGNPIAQHLVAAVGKDTVPDRASDGYIIGEFDSFADTFDVVR